MSRMRQTAATSFSYRVNRTSAPQISQSKHVVKLPVEQVGNSPLRLCRRRTTTESDQSVSRTKQVVEQPCVGNNPSTLCPRGIANESHRSFSRPMHVVELPTRQFQSSPLRPCRQKTTTQSHQSVSRPKQVVTPPVAGNSPSYFCQQSTSFSLQIETSPPSPCRQGLPCHTSPRLALLIPSCCFNFWDYEDVLHVAMWGM